jgi:hypothetical protein
MEHSVQTTVRRQSLVEFTERFSGRLLRCFERESDGTTV